MTDLETTDALRDVGHNLVACITHGFDTVAEAIRDVGVYQDEESERGPQHLAQILSELVGALDGVSDMMDTIAIRIDTKG